MNSFFLTKFISSRMNDLSWMSSPSSNKEQRWQSYWQCASRLALRRSNRNSSPSWSEREKNENKIKRIWKRPPKQLLPREQNQQTMCVTPLTLSLSVNEASVVTADAGRSSASMRCLTNTDASSSDERDRSRRVSAIAMCIGGSWANEKERKREWKERKHEGLRAMKSISKKVISSMQTSAAQE